VITKLFLPFLTWSKLQTSLRLSCLQLLHICQRKPSVTKTLIHGSITNNI